jgi:hypothetical protein
MFEIKRRKKLDILCQKVVIRLYLRYEMKSNKSENLIIIIIPKAKFNNHKITM